MSSPVNQHGIDPARAGGAFQDLVGSLPRGALLEFWQLTAGQMVLRREWDAAAAYLKEAVKLAREKYPDLLVDLLCDLQNIAFQGGYWHLASPLFEELQEAARRADRPHRARALCSLGCNRYMAGSWVAAAEYYSASMEADNEWSVGRRYAFLNYAVLVGETGHLRHALAYEHKCYAAFDRSSDALGLAVLRGNMLYQHASLGDENEFWRLAEPLLGDLTAGRVSLLAYDVHDSIIVYLIRTNRVESATEGLSALRGVMATGRYESRRAWFALREAQLARLQGRPEDAEGIVRSALAQPQIWRLQAAHLLAELSECRASAGDAAAALRHRRAAEQYLKSLGCSRAERRLLLALVPHPSRTKRATRPDYQFVGLLGSSAAVKQIGRILTRLAPTHLTILLQGESGTGKTSVAKAIHDNSTRKGEAFVRLDCTCTEEALLEALLFGHRRGAFTGAIADRTGLVELANRGTLFLDEIGDLSLPMQGKLLSLLEEGVYRIVGSPDVRKADVRFIAATHRDLKEEVLAKRFRQDLYYRIATCPVAIPPLRERVEDIPGIVKKTLAELAEAHGIVKHLGNDVMPVLLAYKWPGNVRELRHVLERSYALADQYIATRHLGIEVDVAERTESVTLAEVERQHISQVLRAVNGNKSKAARRLGVKRTTLYSRLQALGMGWSDSA